jgi:hypothetical protein
MRRARNKSVRVLLLHIVGGVNCSRIGGARYEKHLLVPSFTVRSSGGLRGSEPTSDGLWERIEPLNQKPSGR